MQTDATLGRSERDAAGPERPGWNTCGFICAWIGLWLSVGMAAAAPSDREEELRRAFELLDAGKSRQALKVFEGLHRAAEGDCLNCLLGMAMAHSSRGALGDAEASARLLIESTEAPAFLVRGYNLLGYTIFRSTEVPQPWTPDGLANGGRAHLSALERLREAERAFRLAVELDEAGDEMLRRNLSEVRGWLSMVGEDVPFDETAVAGGLGPDLVDAAVPTGDVLLRQGRLEEAIAALRDQLRYQPDAVPVRYNLALALQRGDRLEEAIEVYREVLAIDPLHGPSHNNLANALRAQGRLEEAIEVYQRLLEEQPDYAGAASNMSSAYRHRGDAEEAVAAAQRALELDPEDGVARSNLALGLDDLGRLEDAVVAYGRALDLQPTANLYNNLGIALRKLDRINEARDAFLRAVDLAPRNVAAHSNLGGILRKQGHLAQATQAYRNAIELAPENPVLYNNLAIVLRDMGEIEASVEAYITALELWE